jgi:hypothetical protein
MCASVQRTVSAAEIGEGGNVGAAGQCQMKFGGAPPDLPHALQHRGRFGVSGRRFFGQQALLVDEAVERGAGDRPGIALIADKFMHDGKRRARLAFHQLDRAEQCGRILEMGDVNQKAPDLDFRVHARSNAAQDFHDVPAVRHHA